MSKLNVNEIEATSTNTNVKVVPKGADATCEIKGTDDATLQLNCSAQSHGVKLKAPTLTAGQNYTMILPDNQIAANKLLKVKSTTGTGATAVGQLEFADEPPQDISSLNASNLTSGTIPSARMPTIPASAGTALELVSKHTVGSTAVSDVTISISDQDSVYKLIGRNIQLSSAANLEMFYQNSAGGQYSSGRDYTRAYHNSTSTSGAVYLETSSSSGAIPLSVYSESSFSFIAEFAPKAGQTFMMMEGYSPGTTGIGARHQQMVTMFYNWQGIGRIKFAPTTASVTIQPNSEFVLYKYKES
tara:strand:+ start:334 stop:1236 length:903 start_codon:yes stop_codon:yes gene_type:complete